jgi:hypothetical protein
MTKEIRDMSTIDDATGRAPHSPRRYILSVLAAALIALGTSALSPAAAAALSTFDRVTAFVDSSGLCANGAQSGQNIGSASVPDIRCSNASFSATTSALSEYGALHALGDLRFTGFNFGPQTQFASFEVEVRSQYFDTLLFGPDAATWEVTVGVSGQSVFITNGTAFEKNVGWCFNLFGAVCGSSSAALASIGTATFSVPIPKNGILTINPALLIDLSTSFQRDGSGAPPPTLPANFDNFVDLSHTVQFLGSRVLDASGQPIIGATISADSGFNYLATVPSVPEASSFGYMALGLAGVMLAWGHAERRQRHKKA